MSDTTRSRKRRKTDESAPDAGSKPSRTRKGKLSALTGMPIDILLEIFSHLLPADLLRLSRLNKDLRRILLHRSSMAVWRSARFSAQELPEPPEEISEPAWAHLAFDAHCHFCNATGVRSIDWMLRKRICKKCSAKHLIEFPAMRRSREITAEYSCLALPYRPLKAHYTPWDGFACLKSDVKAMESTLRGLDEDTQKTYLSERKAAVDKMEAHERRCSEWAAKCSSNRASELDTLRAERYVAICQRLRDLGWGPEIDFRLGYTHRDLDFRRLKQVNQPVKLTNKIWSNIRDKVVEAIAKVRDVRLEAERKALISARQTIAIEILRNYKLSQLPYSKHMPTAADFCIFPVVKALIDQPSDIEVISSSFDEVVGMLPDLLEEWRTKKLESLKARLEREQPEDTNIELVVNALQCKCRSFWDDWSLFQSRRTILFYPEVLAHYCLSVEAGQPEDASESLDGWFMKRRAWDPSELSVELEDQLMLTKIVRSLGLDPRSATARDLDDTAMYLLCMTCIQERISDQPVQLFGWRNAVQHLDSNHMGTLDRDLFYLLEEELDLSPPEIIWKAIPADSILDMPTKRISGRTDRTTRCFHCLDLADEHVPDQLEVIKAHLASEHDVTDPREDRDYYIPFPRTEPTVAYNSVMISAEDWEKLKDMI